MKLSLKNIGKIRTASVEINGITVIAGENDTGKSTVGRALFAVFNSFYDIQKQIDAERIRSVKKLLDRIDLDDDPFVSSWTDTNEIAKAIVSLADRYKEDNSSLKQKIPDLFEQYSEEGVTVSFDDGAVDETAARIQDVFRISERELLRSILEKKLSLEFNGQISNIFTKASGKIGLEIRNRSISLEVEGDRVVEVSSPDALSLHTEAIYIDDPFVLDGSGGRISRAAPQYADHQIHLRIKLFADTKEGDLLDEVIAKGKLENIYEKITSVCEGDIIRGRRAEIGYRRKDNDKVLNAHNLSTGLKTFVILKMLLTNGTIESNGVIILDEPEIHLHPEWQLLFAELIVLLQKEFGVHILLNTHSPYFLRAIQVYSAKYEIADTCKYYLSEIVGDQAEIMDVTECIDRIYAKLSSPLQKLEDERWQDDRSR